MPTKPSLPRLLAILSAGAFALSAVLLCAFKIMDRDFWWHITAGQMIWETGKLIAIEPFAYTRAGLPYLANHEWLAQIALFFVYHLGGDVGIILLRTAMMILTFGLLLLIDRKRLFPNALIAILAAAAILPGFLERPQIFTFLILAAELLLASRYLSIGRTMPSRIGILTTLIILDILWWNMHGAAALVGLGIVGALFLERAFPAWLDDHLSDRQTQKELLILFLACIAAALALFATPSGIQTVNYMVLLLTDKTIAFISEWQPRQSGYLLFMGPVWLLGLLPLLWARKNVVFSIILLAALGYLSVRSLRHEMLFALAALAICFHQLKDHETWNAFLERLTLKPFLTLLAVIVVLLPIGTFAQYSYRQMVARDNLWGYGVFAPAAGAAEFVDREGITGNMFNTYGIGGYLIHRFSPDRKVFIDGRNVDYGYDFMEAAFLAGHTAQQWKVIEDRYKIDYALVDYDAIKQPQWLSYSHVLEADSTWPMVYIDDWTAVYVKNLPKNQSVIKRDQYKFLTAEGLEFSWALEKTPREKWGVLEAELRRAISSNPSSVKARILLGKLLLQEGKSDEVLTIADSVEHIQPHRPEAFALRGAAYLTRQDFVSAAKAFQNVSALAGSDYPELNHALIANVYEKAGWTWKASWERFRSGTGSSLENSLTTGSGSFGSPEVLSGSSLPPGLKMMGSGSSLPSGIGNLFQETQDQIQKSNDAGIAAAEKGEKEEARKAFMQALMLDPGNPQTCNNLAALSIQENDLTNALDYLKRALDRDPKFADAKINMAIVLWKTGKKTEAIAAAKEAKKLGSPRADDLIAFMQKK
ncbi:MAG: tetratricopeptide repeat protein [Candidatus Peregrinibacteria bacterium]